MDAVRDERRVPPQAEKVHPLSRLSQLMGYLPRGNLLDSATWHKRHTLLRRILFLHAPALFLFGLWRDFGALTCGYVVAPALACLALSELVSRRRLSSFFVTAGLVYCSSALVGLSGGSIEAHFHFFIIIGFIALYQDWVPFLWNIVFTVISHGLGSAWRSTLIFNHLQAQQNPWLWSLIHGVSVLAACVGMVIFWRYSEDEQRKAIGLRTQIAQAEIDRRRFTSDLLVNLARRNQTMIHRQLDIINHLEEQERDPDTLADLFRLDHLATQIRRNAESLLVLSGEDPPRVWGQPVRLRDVVRAAIAETEDLDRVVFEVDEDLAVLGHLVTGLTHLLAELLENAVRFSPPLTNVTVRVRPDPRTPGTQVLTVEDWGLGMPPEDMAAANQILATPPDVDVSTSRRFGLHVVSRLARRHGIDVRLTTTAVGGVTAAVILPSSVFVSPGRWPTQHPPTSFLEEPSDLTRGLALSSAGRGRSGSASLAERPPARSDNRPGAGWNAWWEGGPPPPAETRLRPGSDSFTMTPAPAAPQEPLLAQRTPQANLAPQLRRPAGSAAAEPIESGPETGSANEALSRYQASRQAALDEGNTLGRRNRHENGGGPVWH